MTLVIKQNYCHDAVLHDALAITVHRAEPPLRPGKALHGGLAIPLDGFLVVLDHALAVGVHHAKGVLRVRIPLLRGLAKPRRRFDVVTPDKDGNLSEEDRERTLKGLLQIYRSPENYFHLYNLCEAAVEHDQWILMWRFHHVRVVERLIGTKRGTGGSMGVKYLASTLEKRAFPLIWQVRGLLEDNDFYGKERGITKPDDECG